MRRKEEKKKEGGARQQYLYARRLAYQPRCGQSERAARQPPALIAICHPHLVFYLRLYSLSNFISPILHIIYRCKLLRLLSEEMHVKTATFALYKLSRVIYGYLGMYIYFIMVFKTAIIVGTARYFQFGLEQNIKPEQLFLYPCLLAQLYLAGSHLGPCVGKNSRQVQLPSSSSFKIHEPHKK